MLCSRCQNEEARVGQHWCRECKTTYDRERSASRRAGKIPLKQVTVKACRDCAQVLPAKDFYRKLHYADGFNGICKQCADKRQNEYATRPRVLGPKRQKNMDFLYIRPLPSMNHLSEVERAYIAGIVDGEGHMSISLYMGHPAILLHVVNTNHAVILWLHEKLGGCEFVAHRADAKCKTRWRWEVRTLRARAILCAIQPFLIIKKRHSELIEAFYAALQEYRETRPCLIFRDSVEEPLKSILVELKALNRKGPPPS